VRHQFGPDGIIDMREEPYAGWTPQLPRPLGAIGSTFDTDTQAPLFVRTAFFQRPPLLIPPDGESLRASDLTFHFFKLRFRRALAGFDAKRPRSRGAMSEWTEGYWVQSLPPSNWWRVRDATGARDERVRVDDLVFSPSDGRIHWGNAAATVLPSGPTPQPTDSFCRFEVFALITRRVRDAFGRGDQETFVGLAHVDQLPNATFDRHTAHVRLIEVQFRLPPGAALPVQEGPEALNTLAKALFPQEAAPDSPFDAPARIVRTSPRLRILA
jgi:hypothetical protein